MTRTDDLITHALSEEDRALLAQHGEPGYVTQAFELFRGRLSWVIWLSYLTGFAAFIGFGYALWLTWHAADPIAAIRYGVLAAVLFQYTAMIKTFLGSHLEANRMLREIKRVELQVALMAEPKSQRLETTGRP